MCCFAGYKQEGRQLYVPSEYGACSSMIFSCCADGAAENAAECIMQAHPVGSRQMILWLSMVQVLARWGPSLLCQQWKVAGRP